MTTNDVSSTTVENSVDHQIEFREHSTVTLVRAQADDQMIVDDARLSTAGPVRSVTKDNGLVRSLMRERHGTPFEAPQFCFEIEAPIFVAREAHRHRIASVSEMSSRYVELMPVFWVPPADRPLVQTGKAMAYQLEHGDDAVAEAARWLIEDCSKQAWEGYRQMLDQGVAKEVARVVLPVNVFTKWRLRINGRSLLNFLSLRTVSEWAKYPSKPQLEIQEIAIQMEAIAEPLCPAMIHSFNEWGRVAP